MPRPIGSLNKDTIKKRTAERVARWRERQKEKINSVGLGELWKRNRETLPKTVLTSLLKTQQWAIDTIFDLILCNKLMGAKEPSIDAVAMAPEDLKESITGTFENAMDLIKKRGFENHRLPDKEILELLRHPDVKNMLSIGSDILLPDGLILLSGSTQVGREDFLLYTKDSVEYSFFGCRTRMQADIFYEFLYRAAGFDGYLRKTEGIDFDLQNRARDEYGKAEPEIKRRHSSNHPGFEDFVESKIPSVKPSPIFVLSPATPLGKVLEEDRISVFQKQQDQIRQSVRSQLGRDI